MNCKVVCILCFLLLIMPMAFGAPGTSCGYPQPLVPDGRLGLSQYYPAYTTYYWAFSAIAGHSYAVEAFAEQDGQFYVPAPVVFASYTECTHDLSSLSTTNTSYWDPAVVWSQRRTFVAPASGTYYLKVQNSDATYHYFRVGLTDTTMFNPRWTTFSGYDTQFGLYNTSNYTVTGTLTVIDNAGTVLGTFAFTIQPGRMALRSTIPSDLNIPRNKFGTATFAHNGPLGAIIGDAYYINGGATVIVPSSFDTRPMLH